MFSNLVMAIIFLGLFAYYLAFEYCRYKAARMLAEGLDGRAVFRIGRSYMRRDHQGVEERVWIRPDDKMAWGGGPFVSTRPLGKLFLRRQRDPGFRFNIEPKQGFLFRNVSLDIFSAADFNVPELDKKLRLQTSNREEAAHYFFAPEKQQALLDLFREGFTRFACGHGKMVATRKGISTEDLIPERIDHYFKLLRNF